MSEPIPHPSGHYRFLPGIDPYSCGVIAEPGFEIVRVTLQEWLPWRTGFERIDQWLAERSTPRAQLCALELRSSEPFTMQGFIEFNQAYCALLEAWGLFVQGANPVARTNVCPLGLEFPEPVLYAFSAIQPLAPQTTPASRPTFIVAGAGELRDGILQSDRIIRRGDLSPEALAKKAAYVCQVMQERLFGLGASWRDVTALDAYTIHPLDALLSSQLIPSLPAIRQRGLTWHFTRPPVREIEFEMDLRGVARELIL